MGWPGQYPHNWCTRRADGVYFSLCVWRVTRRHRIEYAGTNDQQPVVKVGVAKGLFRKREFLFWHIHVDDRAGLHCNILCYGPLREACSATQSVMHNSNYQATLIDIKALRSTANGFNASVTVLRRTTYGACTVPGTKERYIDSSMDDNGRK